MDGEPGSLRDVFTAACIGANLQVDNADGGGCDVEILLPTAEPHRLTLGQLVIAAAMNVTIRSSDFSPASGGATSGGAASGGPPSAEDGSLAVVDGSSNKVEDRGGFVYMTGGALVLEGLHLTRFRGSTRGGVLGMRGQGAQTLALRSSIFSFNAAQWYGGAVYAYGADGDVPGSATLEVSRVAFLDNSALYNGGAVHFNGLYGNVTATFSQSRWRRNRATHGGGIANLFGSLTVADAAFHSNRASDAGGGYYQYTASGSPAAAAQFLRSSFSHNSAGAAASASSSSSSSSSSSNSSVGADLHFHTVAEGADANTALLCACNFTSLYSSEADVQVSDDEAACGQAG